MTATDTDADADIAEALAALLAGETDRIALAANTAALVFARVPDINWAGFYFLHGDTLVVGPFQGLPACTRIPLGRGVCGTAAARGETIVVPDVHAFEGHIACDSASRSEIVVPLLLHGVVVGVLDIDSPLPDRFGPAEKRLFEAVARIYTDALEAPESGRTSFGERARGGGGATTQLASQGRKAFF
jgi:GAF domain-containing protein